METRFRIADEDGEVVELLEDERATALSIGDERCTGMILMTRERALFLAAELRCWARALYVPENPKIDVEDLPPRAGKRVFVDVEDHDLSDDVAMALLGRHRDRAAPDGQIAVRIPLRSKLGFYVPILFDNFDGAGPVEGHGRQMRRHEDAKLDHEARLRAAMSTGLETSVIGALTEAVLQDPDPCPGEGKCHGPLSWCRDCGDVETVCDDGESCDMHRPLGDLELEEVLFEELSYRGPRKIGPLRERILDDYGSAGRRFKLSVDRVATTLFEMYKRGRIGFEFASEGEEFLSKDNVVRLAPGAK